MKIAMLAVLGVLTFGTANSAFAEAGKDWRKDCPGPGCPNNGLPASSATSTNSKSSKPGTTGKDWMKDCPGPGCPVDGISTLSTIISEKPKSPPFRVDEHGRSWYRTPSEEIFIWDERFHRPLFVDSKSPSSKPSFFIRPDREKGFHYGLLCKREGSESGPGFYQVALHKLTSQPKKYENQFTAYYQDINRLLGIFTEKECPKNGSATDMGAFLKTLEKNCHSHCAEFAPEFHSGKLFFKESAIKKMVSECASICDDHVQMQNEALLKNSLNTLRKPASTGGESAEAVSSTGKIQKKHPSSATSAPCDAGTSCRDDSSGSQAR